MNDSTPEGSYESQPSQLRAESQAQQASEAAPSPAPVSDAYSLRWRDLAYVGIFYFVVGAALTKGALMAASAILHVPEDALQNLPATYVAVVAASQALLSLAVLAFLWLLVRSRGGAAFWPTLGWRAFSAATPRAALAVRYMLGGASLAIVIQGASYYAGTKSSVPMEDFFRDRPSVLMMMVLGIVVAPLFEETLFRGCIYPVVAGTFGMPAGIFVTGLLFGLAHSPQLAGAWKQVALVTVVGIVLTCIRARAGTVLASVCVHIGYNAFLFGAFYFATGGLRYFPGS